MKLRKIVYGMLCMGALASCSDQMNYHEYNNYDEDFVKLNFSNVGGLITTIYLDLDTDFGNYSGAILGSATDEHSMHIQEILLRHFIMAHGVRLMLKVELGVHVIRVFQTVICFWISMLD